MNTIRKCLVLFGIVWLVGCAATDDIDECHQPESHCQAIGLYNQAVEQNRQGDWRKAAGLAEKALELSTVERQLDYQILCLSLKDLGYVSDLIFVPCNRASPYNPAGLLRQIKQQYPPRPFVFVAYGNNHDGWKVGSAPAGDNTRARRFEVGNAGLTTMQQLELTLRDANGRVVTGQSGELEAGGNWQQTISDEHFTVPAKVQLNEKDGYGVGQD